MSSREIAAVILAAGKSTRMKSDISKLVHPLLGKPIIRHVVEACRDAGIGRIIIVVGHEAEQIRRVLGEEVEYVEQKELLGTGHALMTAAPLLRNFTGDLLVTVGDAPLLSPEFWQELLARHRHTNAAATFAATVFERTFPYGRVLRDAEGHVRAVVEASDCTPEQLQLRELCTSQYCFRAEIVLPLLRAMQPHAPKGEYYLTDIIGILTQHGHSVEAMPPAEARMVLGVNDRRDLMEATADMKDRVLQRHLAQGVTIVDAATTYIESEVTIGRETIIHPFSYLSGHTTIGSRCQLGPFIELRNARIADGVHLAWVSVRDDEIIPSFTPQPFQMIAPLSLKDEHAIA